MTGATAFIAFLDASVLYPATVRNVLMYLAAANLFRPLWSQRVHQEGMAALLRDRPDLRPARIARTRLLMEAHVNDGTVTGYEGLINRLTLPDPDDRHVLAAAIHVGASVIVTMNLRDFPSATLAVHGLTARSPDTFVRRLIGADREAAAAAMRTHRQSLLKPPQTAAEYIATIAARGMTETAAALRHFSDAL